MSSVSSVAEPSVSSVSSVRSRRLSRSSISTDDSEPHVNLRRLRRRKPRVFRARINEFDELSKEQCVARYRLSKGTIRYVLSLIEDQIKPSTARNKAVSALEQLLVTLRYYSSGAFQLNVGDHFHISKSTAGRIIHRVSSVIAQLRPRFITMPTTPDKCNKTARDFYQIARFPNVIGAIDGSHISVALHTSKSRPVDNCMSRKIT